jgi:opacity protein-like surface antigen
MISQSPTKAIRRVSWRSCVVASVLFVCIESTERAQAADLLDDSFLRGSIVPVGYVRWDGIQLGVSVGRSNMSTDFGNATSSLVAYSFRNTTLEDEAHPSGWTTLPNDVTNSNQFGGFIGYNVQWDELVLGFDVGYNRPPSLESSASDSIHRIVPQLSDNASHDVTIQSSASLKLVDYATFRGRAGYAFGQFLPYALIGVAVGRFNYTTSATVVDVWTPNGSTTSTRFAPPTQTDNKDNAFAAGFVAGLGMDVALLPNVFLRGEWEYVAFAPVNGIRTSLNTGRVGVGLRF